MPWVCPNCDAKTELGYNICTECNTPRPGSEDGSADFTLADDNPIRIAGDFLAYMAFLMVAELLIPYLMFRFLGVPFVFGASIVFAAFGVVVYRWSRRDS